MSRKENERGLQEINIDSKNVLISRNMDDWTLADLKKSGLTVNNFCTEPLTSEIELKDRLGFTHIGEVSIVEVGGYWIPYPKFSDYYRLKLKRPIDTKDGRAKYLSPGKKKGFGNKPYIPLVVEE